MCTCVMKEKFENPRLGYFDYVFQCEKNDGKRRIITLTHTNDSEAKQLAELKCEEEKL